MKLIKLSDKTQECIAKLQKQTDIPLPCDVSQTEITLQALNTWLERDFACPKNLRFRYEALKASLFADLHHAYLNEEERKKKKEAKSPSLIKRMLFGMLIIGGVVFAVCEGYDAIASILGMFSAIPAAVVFAAGLAFSLLSVAVFFGFDLLEISKNLDIPLSQARGLLDIYLEQAEQIKCVRKKIKSAIAEDLTREELEELQQLVASLKKQNEALQKCGEQYDKSLQNPLLRILKFVTAAATGILYFGGGFFAGQATATAIAGLFVASISPTFWPIIATGVVIGLAAFCGYWFVQRPGVENLVGRWFGLDQEKIDTLKSEEVAEQSGKLAKLEEQLRLTIVACDTRDNQRDNEPFILPHTPMHPGNTFFRRTRSMEDLSSRQRFDFALNV